MPINVGITFLVGGILGWLVVKLLNPKPQLHGLIIATCASGNIKTSKFNLKEERYIPEFSHESYLLSCLRRQYGEPYAYTGPCHL